MAALPNVAAAPKPGKFSVLRRHKINESDVRRVLSHLKVHDTITENDNLTRPRLKKKKGAPPDEPIPWVRSEDVVQGKSVDLGGRRIM